MKRVKVPLRYGIANEFKFNKPVQQRDAICILSIVKVGMKALRN